MPFSFLADLRYQEEPRKACESYRFFGYLSLNISVDSFKAKLRLLRESGRIIFKDMVFPEILFCGDKLLLENRITVYPAYSHRVTVVLKQADNVGYINVHDRHVMTYLTFVIERNAAVLPFGFAVGVGSYTQGSLSSRQEGR